MAAEVRLIRSSQSLPGRGAAGDPLLFVRFFPDMKYVEHLREICAFVVGARYGNGPLAQRTRVVVHEAVENAVKYATTRSTELSLTIWCDERTLTISVSSVPEPGHLASLKAELEQLYSRDAREAYVEAFRRAAAAPVGSPRLGLARIRYEGEVDLSMTEEEGGRIRVTACGSI